ncbi:unnamed protein product [Symbiodinium natans]|uniref:Uncharacterized protein n=1 Tax=Symbiodinium natans TaxID=878477 RepID=A0A812IGI2_9DINO|nr:unnamed protein product [Symbiodinium natans]
MESVQPPRPTAGRKHRGKQGPVWSRLLKTDEDLAQKQASKLLLSPWLPWRTQLGASRQVPHSRRDFYGDARDCSKRLRSPVEANLREKDVAEAGRNMEQCTTEPCVLRTTW